MTRRALTLMVILGGLGAGGCKQSTAPKPAPVIETPPPSPPSPYDTVVVILQSQTTLRWWTVSSSISDTTVTLIPSVPNGGYYLAAIAIPYDHRDSLRITLGGYATPQGNPSSTLCQKKYTRAYAAGDSLVPDALVITLDGNYGCNITGDYCWTDYLVSIRAYNGSTSTLWPDPHDRPQL